MQAQQSIPKGKLGQFEVSKIGLGCMGISAFYGTNPITEEEAIELIGKALDQGVNHFDTAYVYGENEILLQKAIKKYGRERFVLATKVPPFLMGPNMEITMLDGSVETIKKYCDESLKRLDIEYIDLYYQHRVDPSIPIEEQARGFKELIQEGKIKSYGLSECSAQTIRRAHAVHPVTAIQEEYSLFTRDIEQNGVLDACKELDIALVAYSPLGRGILTGNIQKVDDLSKEDARNTLPRFEKENLEKNTLKVQQLTEIAKELDVTVSQLALAWVLHKGDNILPIPGTKREKYLTLNNQSAQIKLSEEQINKIEELFPAGSCIGDRYPDAYKPTLTVDTPEQKSN